MSDDKLTPGQKAANTRKRNAAGQKAALSRKLRSITPKTSNGTITFSGAKAKRGERMTRGTGWRLAVVKGEQRVFVGTLLETINIGKNRLAIFSVPK